MSLSMLVKNEANNLPRCLDSVQDYQDEIIIVDIGSENQTKEIARSYDAVVVDYPWSGNFAAAIIKNSKLSIRHYGYQEECNKSKTQTKRNLSLLKEELKTKPNDPFINYDLGVIYYVQGDLELAKRYYQAAIENLVGYNDFSAVIFRDYVICLYDLGEYDSALKSIERALAEFADYPDLYYLKGEVNYDLGYLQRAEYNFLRATDFDTTQLNYTTTLGVDSYLALESLADISLELGDTKQAILYLKGALQSNYSYRLLLNLVKLKINQGQEILETIEELSDELNLKVNQSCNLAYDCKQYQESLVLAEREDELTAQIYVVKSLLQLREYQKAQDKILSLESKEEFLELLYLSYWLAGEDPKRQIVSFSNSSEVNEDPYYIINQILFNDDYRVKQDFRSRIKVFIKELSIKFCEYRRNDLSLLLIEGFYQCQKTNLILIKLLLQADKLALAKGLLKESVEQDNYAVCDYLQLAQIYYQLDEDKKAFDYMLKADSDSLDAKLITLEVLLRQLSRLLGSGNKIEVNNQQLQGQLKRLISLKQKIKLIGGSSNE